MARFPSAPSNGADSWKNAPRCWLMRGVQFVDNEELTGATFHDILVLYKHLPEISQAKLMEEIRKLTTRYVKAAPEFLRLVA